MRVRSARGQLGVPNLLPVVLIYLVIGIGTAGETLGAWGDDPNDLRWDLARRFGFTVESVQMSSTLDLTQDGALSETARRVLTLSVGIRMLDSNDLAALDVDDPTILEVLGADGKTVGRLVRPFPPIYKPVDLYVEAGSGRLGRGPSRFSLQLPFDPNQPVPASISALRGYLYALYAPDIIEADVPFKVGDFVRVLADLEICVLGDTPPPPGPVQTETVWVGSIPFTHFPVPICLYKYNTYVRSCTGGVVLAAKTRWPGGGTTVDYTVMKTQLVDSKAKTCTNVPSQSFAYGSNGPICSGCKEQDAYDYDVIRHIIAVRPYEVKVPFVLTNIPVPSCTPAGK